MGANRAYLFAEPADGVDPGALEAALTDWEQGVERSESDPGRVAVVAHTAAGREAVRDHLAGVADRLDRVLHLDYVDASVCAFGHLYEADPAGEDGLVRVDAYPTGGELPVAVVSDYFTREYGIDGQR